MALIDYTECAVVPSMYVIDGVGLNGTITIEVVQIFPFDIDD